ELEAEGDFTGAFVLLWPKVTDQMRLCWNDEEYTTEQAAYGVSLLLIQHLTDFTVIERSPRGTGFDYWLGKRWPPLNYPFKNLPDWKCRAFDGVIGGRFGPELHLR
ncbi:MAG: hypothetical protein MI757_12690, partial [Pirellulales bacterium]|nr:hypothetical protein [Pirellulales bacterium]